MRSIRHLLVPTDFSDGADAALQTALIMAQRFSARVTLLHVHQMPLALFPDAILPLAPQLVRDVERSVELVLEELAERGRALGLTVDIRTATGAVAVEICAAVEAIDADLIVLGGSARGGIGQALRGSIAERVLRKASCAVLAVRERPVAASAQL